MDFIDNPFAVAVVFYFNYRRDKLSIDFLNKLIKKYGNSSQKSASMLLELKKKLAQQEIERIEEELSRA